MTARQHKAGFLMPRQVEAAVVKGDLAVALLTTIEVGSPPELPFMNVLMAAYAARELDLEDGGPSGRDMTRRALELGVFALQFEAGLLVVSRGVMSGSKTLH